MRACQQAVAALVCAALATPGAAAATGPDAPLGLAEVDRELEEIDGLVAGAYFRTALAVAEATRGLLAAAGDTPETRGRRARLEVLAATAALAVGQRSQARASLERALAADPSLALDEQDTSPRVVALLRETRAALGQPAEQAP